MNSRYTPGEHLKETNIENEENALKRSNEYNEIESWIRVIQIYNHIKSGETRITLASFWKYYSDFSYFKTFTSIWYFGRARGYTSELNLKMIRSEKFV